MQRGRGARSVLAVGALMIGLGVGGCDRAWQEVMNTGAQSNSANNVGNGDPNKQVLCLIPSSTDASKSIQYLIPSWMIVKYGTCGLAWANASAQGCEYVDVDEPHCWVNG